MDPQAPAPDPTSSEVSENQTEAVAERPDYVPEQFWKEGSVDLEAMSSEYSQLSAFKAVQDERLGAIPEKPEEYDFSLSEGFQLPELPEGMSFELKDDDPRREPLSQWAKEAGITKPDFQKLIDIYAGHEASEMKKIHETASSEIVKLGSGAEQRITDLRKSLNSRLSKEQATALSNAMTTADAVLAVEKLIQLTADKRAPQTNEVSAPDIGLIGSNASERLDNFMRKGTH